MFKAKFRPMGVADEWAKDNACEIRRSVLRTIRPQGEIDTTVLEKTLLERDSGWLSGPLPESALESHAILSRRFGVLQEKKVRMIDNLTSSYVNKAVQAYESPQPMLTDVIAGIGQTLMRLCKGKKFFGKVFDLSSTYRQLPIHPDSSWCSYVACADPNGGKPLIFRMSFLPFGSAMAVFAFLRVAISVYMVFRGPPIG